jgi:hypothetical protein
MVILHFNVLIAISVVIIGLLVWNFFLWREISKLDKDLRWWRDEAVRLNEKLPKRDSKGRFCKREE